MAVIEPIEALASTLRRAGHQVVTPSRQPMDDQWGELSLRDQVAAKRPLISAHLDEIRQADAVLIANFAAKGVEGYVGSNTLMEVAFARALGIPVHLLNQPGPQPCQVEVLAVATSILDSDPLRITDGRR